MKSMDVPPQASPEQLIKRRRYIEKRMIQVNICMPLDMVEWLENQPEGINKAVRKIIRSEMNTTNTLKA